MAVAFMLNKLTTHYVAVAMASVVYGVSLLLCGAIPHHQSAACTQISIKLIMQFDIASYPRGFEPGELRRLSVEGLL